MKLSRARKRRLLDDGYVVVPGVVPKPRLDAAMREINHRLGTGSHPTKDAYADDVDYLSERSDTPAIMSLLYESPLWALAESLLGAGQVERPSQGQIALRFPAENDETDGEVHAHIDGMYSKNNPEAIERFTMCAGILLSDLPRKDMGNLTVFPGSHRQIAGLVKKSGTGFWKTRLVQSIKLPEPEQVTGKKGDVVLFHFQLAHDRGRNLSSPIRCMVYFRFSHVNAWRNNSIPYLRRAMTDLWLEWPGVR
ncbi:MAG: phytanoyl-CoA dioxygenase family protein [Elusimicrobia bacterium]|nr:phytanoyl-CoA dioxygenase family protein [Elusimicrobiota bacterium]